MTKKIAFVLSTGRTGTVSLAKILNNAPNVTALHEPKPTRLFHYLSRFYLKSKKR